MSGRNAYSIHDIISVRSNTALPVPDRFRLDPSSVSSPDIVVEKGSINADIDRQEMTRSGMFYFGTVDDALVIDYMLPMVDVTLLIKDLGEKTIIRYTPSYERFGSVGLLFNTILQFKLIQQDHVLVHAGCVGTDAAGTLVAGMRNTGKTSTILSLVDAETKFLSDDLTILGRDGTAYCYPTPVEISPFTLTGEVLTYTGSVIQQWVARQQILSLLIQEFIGYELSEKKQIPDKYITERTRITKVGILGENGPREATEIPTEAATNRLLMSTAELLDPFRIYSLNFFSFYLDYSTADLFTQGKDIINDAIENAACYELHAESVEGYPSLLD